MLISGREPLCDFLLLINRAVIGRLARISQKSVIGSAGWEAPQLLRLGYFGMALASYGLLRDGTYQRLQN